MSGNMVSVIRVVTRVGMRGTGLTMYPDIDVPIAKAVVEAKGPDGNEHPGKCDVKYSDFRA